ncbi:MAG: SigmaK-factor processing regulatory BofA [Ruminococcaceae bacterium]|nr:SigmaK-factor processing regulatory BofA [Oscillospiraceae bacterium]
MLQMLLLFGLLALMLFIITLPVRLGWKVLCNALCGFGSLIVLNLLHPITGMLFELNVLTCAIVGTLGLPGVGALVIAHYVLGG